ncbi:MAG: type II secretion system F family protein [Methylobacteriaceae bacterium]|nr:type II secretion system F family protein [Methylobacteriaceae bacterium]
MWKLIFDELQKPQTLGAILVGIAVMATVITLAMPLLEGDNLARRMKAVASERERIRQRERERLAAGADKVTLRYEPKAFMKRVVDNLSLQKWFGTDTAKQKLWMAGYRGPQAEIAFVFFRLVTPIAVFLIACFYIFLVLNWNQPTIVKVGAAIFAAYIGIKMPEIFLANATSKRQQSMSRAFPNSLDLLLICVESGMSIEHAFRKVSQEIGSESIPMAEELTLTTAELSYLPDRRSAFENLANRTGLESVRSLSTVLVQAERYGTPLGTALRVLAQESRDQRMNEAEKKAAALPPKLTVPMILFFLPVLFAVILTPALIQIFHWS